jgi:hypothetical protein
MNFLPKKEKSEFERIFFLITVRSKNGQHGGGVPRPIKFSFFPRMW